jgi:hypothetical protein
MTPSRDDEFDSLLHNWATWARSRGMMPCSCRSLESRYIAPPVWYYPELRVDPVLKDALYIEGMLVAQTFPKASMAAIVYAYVYPWRRLEAALRKINGFKPTRYVKPNNFEEFLKDSKRILFNRIKLDTCTDENDVLSSHHNSTTGPAERAILGEVFL